MKTFLSQMQSGRHDAFKRPDSPLVIVAEKYPLSRAALADLLTGDGYRVFQSDNVNAAMTCIDRNNEVAVLLADLEMPGWKSLVRHTLARTPTALVIGMLGTRSVRDDNDLSQRGVRVCLAKPISYEDIQRAIASKYRR